MLGRGKRKTTDQFKVQAIAKHGDKYDYSKVDYKNCKIPIEIICSKPGHGSFFQRPAVHLSGSGCKKCMADNQRKPKDVFLKQAIQKHGNKYDYGNVIYQDNKTPVKIKCPKHGYFEQSPSSHLKHGCPKCGHLTTGESKRKSTETFILDAKKVHGNQYAYGKVEYIRSSDPVTITCLEYGHGDFFQTPNHHLTGNGCPTCGKTRKSTRQFIKEAREIHGETYDYSNAVHINKSRPIIVICLNPKHGPFEITPIHHLKGFGCHKCSDELNKETFITGSRSIHGYKYDYSKVVDPSVNSRVPIICPVHGEFLQLVSSHMKGHGCSKCRDQNNSLDQRKSHIEFLEESRAMHGGDVYDYSSASYVNAKTKVIIICTVHGAFQQTPDSHLRGNGCRRCSANKLSQERRKTKQEFISAAQNVHGETYDYTDVDYINAKTNVSIICSKHGDFKQTPDSHLRGSRCPKCVTNCYSKAQIEWLRFNESRDNLSIQSIVNGGEFKIGPYKVDGFHRETNTCYEFHGDYWHGNPKIYDSNAINRKNNTTFGDLYRQTQIKEEFIRRNHNLVVMWESDWNQFKQNAKKIQKWWKSIMCKKIM